MYTTPNLTNLATWNIPKPLATTSINSSLTNFTYKPKPKLLNYPVTVVNNFNKPDDRGCNDTNQSKYFLTPLGGFQLTPEECKEILMKRASLAATSNLQTLNDSCSNTSSLSSSSAPPTPVIPSPTKLRPYSCIECGKTFIQKHHLTTHKKVHSGIRPHACNHCGKAFIHKHCLNTHLLLHSGDRPFECQECKKSFTLKHHLISHAKVHSREKPFICTDCGCAFPLKRHLVTHSKFHAGERPFVCEECGESFAHENHLVMHSRFHGSTNSFVCHDCGSSFTRKFELVNHSRLHGHVPLSCPVCHKEFLQKRTLVVHMRLHTSNAPFNCVTCGESFQLRNELHHHMTTHNSLSPTASTKHLSCSECGSGFNNPEALALHVKLHSGDASFVNDLCALTANLQNSGFSSQSSNSSTNGNHNHTQTIKSETPVPKVKSHICKFCSKAFSAKHGLQQHNKRHPEGTCALRSHVCEICNKAFYQKNHLLLHQRQHMDVNGHNPSFSKTKNNPSNNENIYEQRNSESKLVSHNPNKSTSEMEYLSKTDKRDSYLSYYDSYAILKGESDSRKQCPKSSYYEGCNTLVKTKQLPNVNHQKSHNTEHLSYYEGCHVNKKGQSSKNDNAETSSYYEPFTSGRNEPIVKIIDNQDLRRSEPSAYYDGCMLGKNQPPPIVDNKEPCSSESSLDGRNETFTKSQFTDSQSDSYRIENLRNIGVKMHIISDIDRMKHNENFAVTGSTAVQ